MISVEMSSAAVRFARERGDQTAGKKQTCRKRTFLVPDDTKGCIYTEYSEKIAQKKCNLPFRCERNAHRQFVASLLELKHLPVTALLCQQAQMIALLDHVTTMQHQNSIRLSNR